MTNLNFSRRAVVAAAAGLAVAPGLGGTAQAAVARRVTILGDSITAGYGLPASQALPAILQGELVRLGASARVVPYGVVGDTTGGALNRVDRAAADADVCVVALGGNDLLQGADPTVVRRNLDAIVRRLKARGVTVVLAGLRVPPLLQGSYAEAFNGAFASVARSQDVLFIPDMLNGVVLNPLLNQRDGVHPNAAGVQVIARRLAPVVARALATA
ncbi:arylesterase [Phenylobacterium deserti]|uniref:Arylesterase n=1 Tax=Phenylobacterium deserti TaxID=1914756 RepID=A0A328AQZ4_9CAUL|nr:arylesterase [Phenylobacterium deserti]RAK57440.1 arylesterase [Phenylobacterium deserti]